MQFETNIYRTKLQMNEKVSQGNSAILLLKCKPAVFSYDLQLEIEMKSCVLAYNRR